jgi:hypothetical protein
MTTAGGLLAFNLVFAAVEVSPASGAISRLMPESFALYYSRACGGLLIGFAAVFWVATVVRTSELRSASPVLFASALAAIILVLSTLKITHQFSSRYVAVAFPFMVLAAAPYRGTPSWEAIRIGIGSGLGFLMLRSYFTME